MKMRCLAFSAVLLASVTLAHAQAPVKPGREDLLQARDTLHRILQENIIPFWMTTIDREQGGYNLNHDVNGKYLGASTRTLVTQARTVWFFSRLANSPYAGAQRKEYLEAARIGYEFLRDHMYDKEHGGFYTAMSPTGKGATTYKHLYGQGFALYALTEYGQATGKREPRRLARTLFRTLEERAHDARHGGYRELFQRDWSLPPQDARSYMGVGPDIKLYNTHLHLLEPVTTYYRATRDPLARERLLELLTILSNTIVRKDLGACTDKFALDWTPLLTPEYAVVSYGHDIENVWLVMEAAKAAGLPSSLFRDLYTTLYDYSLQYGWDEQNGGFYYWGPFRAPAKNLEKSWWVQAETLVSALRMYEFTNDPKYFAIFDKTLDWLVNHQIDWKNGDWFADILPNGTARGQKAGPWKSPYHNGRTMIECLTTLDALLAKK